MITVQTSTWVKFLHIILLFFPFLSLSYILISVKDPVCFVFKTNHHTLVGLNEVSWFKNNINKYCKQEASWFRDFTSSTWGYDVIAYVLIMKLWVYEIHIFELRNEEINVKKILAVINTTDAVAKRKPEKIRLAGIRTLTSAIPVQRSNQLS